MNYTSNLSIDRLKICFTVDTTYAKEISDMETVWNLGEYQISPTSPQSPHIKSYNIKFPDPSNHMSGTSVALTPRDAPASPAGLNH